MSLFTLFSGMLGRAVGNNQPNDPADVRITKNNLNKAGYFTSDDKESIDNPFLTRKMDDSIKRYQKDKNLKIDGVMKPGGETERSLYEHLTGERAEKIFPVMQDDAGTIGFGGNVSGTLAPIPQKKPKRTMIATPPIPRRKPETISPTKKGNELLDFIGQLESSDNYNIIYGGEEKPLTKMTIKEVYALQKKMITEGRGSSVVGRYQFKYDTLKETVDKLGVSEDSLFNEKLQDRLARVRLEYRGFEKYKAGEISTETLIKRLANEWAALPPDTSNKSRYEGVLNNRALTKFEILKALLEKR